MLELVRRAGAGKRRGTAEESNPPGRAAGDRPGHLLFAAIWNCILPHWSNAIDKRLLDKIGAVFDYTIAHEWRKDKNPAVWKDRLEKVMPPSKTKHLAALAYDRFPKMMKALRESHAFGARHGSRTSDRNAEAREARWGETDFEKALWTVPASRMKERVMQEVPLSDRAMKILPDNAARHWRIGLAVDEKAPAAA